MAGAAAVGAAGLMVMAGGTVVVVAACGMAWGGAEPNSEVLAGTLVVGSVDGKLKANEVEGGRKMEDSRVFIPAVDAAEVTWPAVTASTFTAVAVAVAGVTAKAAAGSAAAA
jgi:hypothetical protein